MAKHKEKLLLTIVLLIIFSPALYRVLPTSTTDETLVRGIYLGSHPADGLIRDGLADFLSADRESVESLKLYLQLSVAEDEGLEFSFQELGIELDLERIWQEAYQVGRTGSWWNRMYTRWQVRRKGLTIPLYLKIEKEKAFAVLATATKQLHIPPQDARLMITPKDKIEILPAVMGRKPDLEQLMSSLTEELAKNEMQSIHLRLTYQVLEPKISTSEVKNYRITGLISSFATYYNVGNVKRAANVQLAAKAIDGYLLPPGEVFSFNGVVGPRTKERGYQEANVIINKQMVPDLGGGVCQVSSTLYNAVLQAELEVVERYPHSLRIGYVPPGLDAAVVYGSKDFSFLNNAEGHLLIKSFAEGGRLTFKIYGLAANKRKVVLKSFTEKEVPCDTIYLNDPLVPQGEFILEKDGVPGLFVRTERYIYKLTGELLRQEIISRDYYPPEERVIRTSVSGSGF